MSRPLALALALLAPVSSGCVYGRVFDATTWKPVTDTTVWAVGKCTGAQCASPADGVAETDGVGVFAFDPYSGGSQVEPADGHEALQLLFLKPGYRAVSHFFDPALVAVTDEEGGTSSQVPDVLLTPLAFAADSDGDGLPDAEEAQLGTDPFLPDTDGDLLTDLVEVHGGNFVDLRGLGADPLVRDIFVELDYVPYVTPNVDLSAGPWPSAVDEVVAAFAAEGIQLHLVVDDAIDHDTYLCTEEPDAVAVEGAYGSPWEEFYALKAAHFDLDRQPFFHYALFTGSYCNGDGPSGSSGLSHGHPAADFMVTLEAKLQQIGPKPAGAGLARWEEEVRIIQSGTIMHELGHNLGLNHGGGDAGVAFEDPVANPAYLSVMSYRYQLGGLRRDGAFVIDYSQFPVWVNETALNEEKGLTSWPNEAYADELARYVLRHGNLPGGIAVWQDDEVARCLEDHDAIVGGDASALVDWNQDCVITPGTIQADIGTPGIVLGYIRAWSDWDNLRFDGGDGAIGVSFAPSRERVDDVRPRLPPAGMTERAWGDVLAQVPPGAHDWTAWTIASPRRGRDEDTACE